MTKAELVAAIADKAGLTRTQAKDALEAFIDAVTVSVKSGQEVRVVGFAASSPSRARPAWPATRAPAPEVQRPASKTVRFRVGEGLKSALN